MLGVPDALGRLLYDISVSKQLPAGFEINAVETAKVIFEGLKPASGASVVLLHVKPGGNDAEDGSSWSTAKGTVEAALSAASGASNSTVHLILLASGTYRPAATLGMKNHVAIIGGFGASADDGVGYYRGSATEISGRDRMRVFSSTNLDTRTPQGAVTPDSTAVLARLTVTGGRATNGAGMYNDNSSPTVTHVTFSGNTATDGGGMYNSFSSPTVTRVTFSENTAANGGGGMFNSSSSPTVTHVSFSGNTATNGGGMLNESSSPTVTHVSFSGNTATNGGGMNNESSSPILTHATFSGNTAINRGGGMYNSSSSPTVTHATFSRNTATNGGGMLNVSSSSPTVTHVSFSGNRGGRSGGGMLNLSSSPTVTHATFSGNTARYYGGGMLNLSSSPTVTHATFSGNTAGGGMSNLDSSPKIASSIFWESPIEHTNSAGNTAAPVVAHSMVQGGYAGGTDITTPTGSPFSGALGDNGGFVETIPIGRDSEAKDKGLYVARKGTTFYYSTDNSTWYTTPKASGTPAALPADAQRYTTDARGYSHNGRPDMGAYEHGGTAP